MKSPTGRAAGLTTAARDWMASHPEAAVVDQRAIAPSIPVVRWIFDPSVIAGHYKQVAKSKQEIP